MTAWFRRVWGIVSNLVLHLKRGYAEECLPYSSSPANDLQMAFRYLGVSARRFRESSVCLRLAVCGFGSYLKTLSKFCLGLGRFHESVSPQSQGQTSHYVKIHSCPESDAKNELLSNVKKVDVPDATADHLNPCQNNQNTKNKSNGGRMFVLLFLLCLGIGFGGFLLRLALASRHYALHGFSIYQEVGK